MQDLQSVRVVRLADGRVMVRGHLDLHDGCKSYYEMRITADQAIGMARDLLNCAIADQLAPVSKNGLAPFEISSMTRTATSDEAEGVSAGAELFESDG